MTLKPTYLFFENPDAERAVKRVVAPLVQFLPTWLRSIRVESGTCSNPATAATVWMDTIYRYATIKVYPVFFESSRDAQRRYILHEIIHTHFEECSAFVETRLLDPLKDDKRLHEVLAGEFEDRVERVTQELAFLLDDLAKVASEKRRG